MENQLVDERVFATLVSLVVALADADACESQGFIESNCIGIRRAHLQESILHPSAACAVDQVEHQASTQTAPTQVLANADVENVRFSRTVRHDTVAPDFP